MVGFQNKGWRHIAIDNGWRLEGLAWCEHGLPYIKRALHFQLPYFNICPTVLELPSFNICPIVNCPTEILAKNSCYILNQFGRVVPYIQNALFVSALNQVTPFLTALMQHAPFLSALIQLTLCLIALQLESCPTML